MKEKNERSVLYKTVFTISRSFMSKSWSADF